MAEPTSTGPLRQSVTLVDSTLRLPDNLDCALSDAERLLVYAAEAGIAVADADRNTVLKTRSAKQTEWNVDVASTFLAAFTRIADALKPVTADTLRACEETESVKKEIRLYRRVAIILALIIVPFSLASFVTSAISDAIRKDIVVANELAVKLGVSAEQDRQSQLNSADVTALQQFAATIRAIERRSLQLNPWLLNVATPVTHPPEGFELPVPLKNLKDPANEKIQLYQRVREFGQNVVDTTQVYYGAATACLLPALYALFGACAYLVRTFEQQMKMRSFSPSITHAARFVIAGIGGAVVGLFNNFNVSQGASIPPLAIAFLVGYAVEVFFSFLDNLIHTFTKPKGNPAHG